MAVEFYIHKMTEHMDTARIVRWLVKEGDLVSKGQILLEVETEKAVSEVEAPADGFLKGIRNEAVEGYEVKVGETIAFIVAEGEETPSLPPLIKIIKEITANEGTTQNGTIQKSFNTQLIRATPTARRLSKEFGINLDQIHGGGEGGVIREEDVKAYLSKVEKNEQDGWLELTPIQRLTGQRMVESVKTIPQFSVSVDIDLSLLTAFRDEYRIDNQNGLIKAPSITAILIYTVARIIKSFPLINAVFENNRIRLYREINIGVAVATDGGLFVPVIKKAEIKSIILISQELIAFQTKAQSQRFSETDLTNGTFTISNLGMYGVDRFNAIINPSQSAILAVGCLNDRLIGKLGNGMVMHPFACFSLTVDHRAMDGIYAAKFLKALKESLEQNQLYEEEGLS